MSLEGERLGNYRLLHQLGRGGMGEVYLAEDARIAQQVAMKIILNEGIAYPGSESAKDAARLFEREAKAIARLDHPNILPLYAYGEETLRGMPLTYLVMPYRKEGTLADWLRQRGSAMLLAPAEVAPLLQQAADALQHAHDQQVIHQDIKPTNFLIRLRKDQPTHPDLLLADFGIAKLTSATASASQNVRGTPTYMAPEQWDGQPVAATDQYALAIMVYELLVGRPPFQGGPGQVMSQHYLTPPPAPRTLNSRLSPAIDAVLLRALAKKPTERFPSMTAFTHAFQEAVSSDGTLRATLAISQAEAQMGTTRQLTLPGGRQVSVTVPAGVGDGAILRMEGQGTPSSPGGPSGPLMLRIAIQATDGLPSLQPGSTAPTISGALHQPSGEITQVPTPPPDAPAIQEPRVSASSPRDSGLTVTVVAASTPAPPTEGATPVREPSLPLQATPTGTPLPLRSNVRTAETPRRTDLPQHFVLLGLAGLIIVALASGVVWFTAHHAAPASSPTTALTTIPTTALAIIEYPISTSSSNPIGITRGPDGNLWFTEFNSSRIGRITPNGSLSEYPTPTSDSGPEVITSGPDGNLWFTERFSGNIGRISPSGSITEFPIPTSGSGPNGITSGPDGNLWFTEYYGDGNRIGRISPSGSITEFPIPTSHSGSAGITSGPDGNLWFTEYGGDKIGRITPNGSITEFPTPTSGSSPERITRGPDGNLWFTEINSDKIGRITPNGSITEFPTPTSGSGPNGITSGPDGNLWFTEFGSNQIGRISPNGSITEFPTSAPNSQPIGITSGSNGNLWFTEGGSNKIGRITPNGK